MALTPQLVAELVRLRLGMPDSSDANRIIFLIPEALKAFARKIAADAMQRNLLMTDPAVAVLPIVSGKIDLIAGYNLYKFLLEYIENGQMYHLSSNLPLQKTTALQSRLASSYLANQFVYYYVEGDVLYPSATAAANLSIAAAGVNFTTNLFTSNNHGLTTGQGVTITSDTALPGGLAAGTVYFVVKIDANTFKLATTYANAIAGTVIDISSAGTGTHSVNPNTLTFAVPRFPADLTELPESKEVEKMFIDKLIEMLPESGGDYAQDGEK